MRANTNVFRAHTHYKSNRIVSFTTINQQVINMAYYLFLIEYETDKKLHIIHNPCHDGPISGLLAGHVTSDFVRDCTHRTGAIAPGYCRSSFFPGILLELAFFPGKHAAESYFHFRSFAEPVDQFGYITRRRREFRSS